MSYIGHIGLDITAYKGLQKVENPLYEGEELKNWQTEWMPGPCLKWSESRWPGRAEGVDSETVYSFEDKYEFYAGSYSDYMWWKNKLSDFAQNNYFQELIEFADTEGIIGPMVSKKLAKDFQDSYVAAERYAEQFNGDEGVFWFHKYEDWMKAFDMASDNGAVWFH